MILRVLIPADGTQRASSKLPHTGVSGVASASE
jgi:hypothetical protein